MRDLLPSERLSAPAGLGPFIGKNVSAGANRRPGPLWNCGN